MKVINYIAAAAGGALVAAVAVYRWAPRVEVVERVREIRVSVPAEPVADTTKAAMETLTKENADLQARLEAASAAATATEASLRQTRAQLAELRRPMDEDLMSSALKAELKSGEVVVTGGYRLPDGKRLYAFAQPVVETVDGESVIKISGRLLSLTDAAGKAAGMDNLSTNAANTLQHGEVWVADEQAEVFTLLAAEADTTLMTLPAVTLRSGGSGLLELGEVKLKVTPTLTGEADAMKLELRLEQPQAPAAIQAEPAPDAVKK